MKALLDAIRGHRAMQALRHRDFRLIFYGQSCGNLGTWMDEVTRGWLIYQITDSAVQLGLVRGVQLVPLLLLSPLAGSAADRYSRRTLLVVSQALHGLLFAILAVLVFAGRVETWHVYVTAVLVGIVQAAAQPARAALLADTVPTEYITNAIGVNSLVFNLARALGPALAGALIATSGSTGPAFAVQAVCLLLATAWTAQIREVRKPRADKGPRESFVSSIVEGWKFSWRNEPVRAGILCTVIVSMLMFPFTALLPVFARDLLAVGAAGQGMLLFAMGAGALISAGWIAAAGHRITRGRVILYASMCYGCGLVVFAASGWFALSLAVMVLIGLFHVHANALVATVIQTYAPAEFRGRTMALYSMGQMLSTAGSALIGVLAVTLGPRLAVAAMGLAGALGILAVHLALPNARHIK